MDKRLFEVCFRINIKADHRQTKQSRLVSAKGNMRVKIICIEANVSVLIDLTHVHLGRRATHSLINSMHISKCN